MCLSKTLLVALTVMISVLMSRRDLDSTVSLTSGQPGKTHAERKEGTCQAHRNGKNHRITIKLLLTCLRTEASVNQSSVLKALRNHIK